MRLRIITGSAKGQRLEVPKKGTRPMTDRIKSALFSIINPAIQDAHVLDVYAGTGALGIECLSRGAKSAVFVDRSKDAVAAINNNLRKTGFESLSKVIKCSALRFLDTPDTFNLTSPTFNIIFITPPHNDFREKIIELSEPLLDKDGILIAEHSSKRKAPDRVGELAKFDMRKYGITALSFYK